MLNPLGEKDEDGGLYQGCSSGGGDKWLDPGEVLKAEPIRLPDGLDVECKKKRGVQDNSKGFGWSNWKDEAAIFQ